MRARRRPDSRRVSLPAQSRAPSRRGPALLLAGRSNRHAAENALPGRRCGSRRQPGQAEPGEIAGAQHAAEDGDTERAAGLVDRLQYRRGDAALLFRHLYQRGGHSGGHGDTRAQPGDGHPRRHEHAARGHARRGAYGQADGEQDEAGRPSSYPRAACGRITRGCPSAVLDQLGGIWEVATTPNPAELRPTGLKLSL